MAARFVVTAKTRRDKIAVLDLDDFIEEYYSIEQARVLSQSEAARVGTIRFLIDLKTDGYQCCDSRDLLAAVSSYYPEVNDKVNRMKLAGVSPTMLVLESKKGEIFGFHFSQSECSLLKSKIDYDGRLVIPTFVTMCGTHDSSELPDLTLFKQEIALTLKWQKDSGVQAKRFKGWAIKNPYKVSSVILFSEHFQPTNLSCLTVGMLNREEFTNVTVDLVMPDNTTVDFINAFAGYKNLKRLRFSRRAECLASDCKQMFIGDSALMDVQMSVVDLSNVQSFARMFMHCSSLEEITLSGVDTKGNNYMPAMFSDCVNLRRLEFCGNKKAPISWRSSDIGYYFEMFKGTRSLKEENIVGISRNDARGIWSEFDNRFRQ